MRKAQEIQGLVSANTGQWNPDTHLFCLRLISHHRLAATEARAQAETLHSAASQKTCVSPAPESDEAKDQKTPQDERPVPIHRPGLWETPDWLWHVGNHPGASVVLEEEMGVEEKRKFKGCALSFLAQKGLKVRPLWLPAGPRHGAGSGFGDFASGFLFSQATDVENRLLSPSGSPSKWIKSWP